MTDNNAGLMTLVAVFRVIKTHVSRSLLLLETTVWVKPAKAVHVTS